MEAFEDALRTVSWAKDQIAEFKKAVTAYLASDPTELRSIPTGNGANFTVILKQTKSISDDMRRSAYRIVSDLRNALDQATFAACGEVGTKFPHKCNFPVGENLTDLKKRLSNPKGSYRGIPAELHPKICSFKPYWGAENDSDGEGDTILRTLTDLANPNKHRVPMRTGIDTAGLGILTAQGVGISYSSLNRTISNTEVKILDVTVHRPDYRLEINVGIRIILSNAPTVAHLEAVSIFDSMAERVEEIIAGLQSEVLRLKSI